MDTFRSFFLGRLTALCLLFLLGAAAFAGPEEGDPGDTPPLPTSTSTMVWEYVSALWANPDTVNSKIGAHWIHRETSSWYEHNEYFGVSPLGGSAFNAPVAVAAGRTLDMTRDWYTTAAYTPGTGGNVVEVRNEDGHTIQLDAGNGLSAPRRYGDLALLAADVDGLVEADDSFHDEILVLYDHIQDGVETLRLTVLKHDLTVMAQTDVTNPAPAFRDGPSAGMATADIDANGAKEIGIGYPWYNASSSLYYARFLVYRYEEGALSCGTAAQSSFYSNAAYPVCLAGGDFNGDGIDELFTGCMSDRYTIPYLIEGYAVSTTLAPSKVASINPYFYYSYNPYFTPDQFSLDLAAAWFKDPGTTDLVTKRQLVIACGEPDWMDFSAVDAMLEVVNFPLNWSSPSIHYTTIFANDVDQSFERAPDDLKLVPGNFYGTLNTVPFQDLGLFITQTASSPSGRQVNFIACKVDKSSLSIAQPYFRWRNLGTLSNSFSSLGVAKMDDGGRSLLLGPPTQIIMQDVVTVDYTIEDPPKHIDYLPVNPQDREGEWDYFFFSMFPEFSCKYSKEGENSSSHTEKSVSEGGAGLNASIGADMEVKIHELLAKETIDASLEAKLNFSFQRSIDTADTTYHNYTYSLDQATDRDDIMQYKTRTYTIWRFPLYGYTALNPNTNQQAQGYYDVNFPPSNTTTTFMAGLGCSDFYQPVHQNGNVLTYPLQSSNPYTNDLGSFTLPGSTVPLSQFLNDTNLTYGVDGSEKTLNVTWTGGASGETTQSWTENLSGDVDFKISFSTKMFGCLKAGIDGEIALQGDGSWSQITTDENDSSNTGGLTITVPAMHGLNSSQIYSFTPYVYFSKSGNNKVRHAVTIPSSSAWWSQQYNGLPDPGLNLPNHFLPIWNPYTDDWDEYEVDESDMGKRMRGLFLQTAEAAEATGDPMDVTHSVTEGTLLTVTARVYNFSLKGCATPFDVKFEYVPVNDSDFETGPRVTIGTVRVQSMNPQEVKEVPITWNTANLGPASPSMCNLYRIWVTVDANNEVTAIHPRGSLCDNKEGYWPWNGGLQIYGAAKTAGPVQLTSNEFFPRMRLGMRQPDGALQTGWGTIPQGEWSKLCALIISPVLDRRTLHVVFRDWVLFSDTPQKPLGYKLVQGVSWKGQELGHVAHANFDWRPLQPGVHFIRAELANTSLPISNDNFPFEDHGANLLVWVPSHSAQKDLETAGRCLENLEAERPRIVACGGAELFDRVREALIRIESETWSRVHATLPSDRRAD